MNKWMKLLAWTSAGIVGAVLVTIAQQGVAVLVAALGIFKGFYELMKG